MLQPNAQHCVFYSPPYASGSPAFSQGGADWITMHAPQTVSWSLAEQGWEARVGLQLVVREIEVQVGELGSPENSAGVEV